MSKQSKLLTLLNLILVGFLPIVSFVTKFAYVALYFIGIDYNLYELYLPPYFLLLVSDILSYTLTFWQNNILTYNLLVLSLLCFIKTIYIIIKYDTTRKLLKCNR